MWKLTEIYAQNICAFRELHYHPKQGVTTLIFGDNRDNESQRSNGSGKSALIECIAIGITGSPLRKVRNEEIINDNSDESLIELTFSNEAIHEKFMIERRLFKKGASEVACYVFRGDSFKADEAVMPSVDAYNKYILDVLGISKDELYNNFILSKHKYNDFLSSSDKEKKEIINRFSNGNMVDQAIEEIVRDKEPLQELLRKTDLELAGTEGRISMLKEQIEEEENNIPEKNRTKEERIDKMKSGIDALTDKIRQKADYQGMLDTEYIKIEETEKQLQELENSDLPLEDILSKVSALIPLVALRNMTDWSTVIAQKKNRINDTEKRLKGCGYDLDAAEDEVNSITKKYNELHSSFEVYIGFNKDRAETFNNQLLRLKGDFERISGEMETLNRSRRNLSASFESLNSKLAGIITCPSCHHEFILADKGFVVEDGRKDLIEIEDSLNAVKTRIGNQDLKLQEIEEQEKSLNEQKRLLNSEKRSWTEKLEEIESKRKKACLYLEDIKYKQERISTELNQLHDETDGILRKVFDEGFELMDEAYRQNARNKNAVNEEIKTCETSIETMSAAIRELEETKGDTILVSLIKSLEENKSGSMQILKKKSKLELELSVLERQERNFIEFKTYLANTKIEALSKITNEFLEGIGSDIRVRFSGYTLLKSGKVRDKISVSLIRGGVDCGSFGKFSAGEAARVNLATILAMQKLINSNCDTDKGLDLLVLDEILEAVDEEGLAFMFDSLNRLGNTTLVVSHGNIAESYPHTIKIIKENGESRIEETTF